MIYLKLFENYNNVIYRLGTESDLPRLKNITNQYKNELGFVMNVSLKDAIKRNEFIIAEQDDKIVGFVHFHKRLDGWNTIREIAVLKDKTGHGIGKKLFNMVDKPRRLKTTVDNEKANNFYKNMGMEILTIDPGKKRPLNVWVDKI